MNNLFMHFHTTGVRNHDLLLRVGLCLVADNQLVDSQSWEFALPPGGAERSGADRAFEYCGYDPTDRGERGSQAECRQVVAAHIEAGLLPAVFGSFGSRFLGFLGAVGEPGDSFQYLDVSLIAKRLSDQNGLGGGVLKKAADFLKLPYSPKDVVGAASVLYHIARVTGVEPLDINRTTVIDPDAANE